MLSSFSSLSLEEVAGIRGADQPMWFQLYVNPNRTKTAEMIKRADAYVSGLCSQPLPFFDIDKSHPDVLPLGS